MNSPNAQVIATRDEYEYAFAPDWFAAGGYIQKDFNKTIARWALLEATEDGYDVFGDGTIRCWRTPGHAPGHQSFEVTLRNSGAMLLTVDADKTMDDWEEKALPGFLASVVDTVRSAASSTDSLSARTRPSSPATTRMRGRRSSTCPRPTTNRPGAGRAPAGEARAAVNGDSVPRGGTESPDFAAGLRCCGGSIRHG